MTLGQQLLVLLFSSVLGGAGVALAVYTVGRWINRK